MDMPTKHQLVIAKKALHMSGIMTKIMGGMNHAEARAFLRSQGWPIERIKRLEESS